MNHLLTMPTPSIALHHHYRLPPPLLTALAAAACALLVHCLCTASTSCKLCSQLSAPYSTTYCTILHHTAPYQVPHANSASKKIWNSCRPIDSTSLAPQSISNFEVATLSTAAGAQTPSPTTPAATAATMSSGVSPMKTAFKSVTSSTVSARQ